MNDDLGAALRGNVEDRRDDPWQWWMPPDKPLAASLPHSISDDTLVDKLRTVLEGQKVPEENAMGVALGSRDIRPLTKEELLQHILFIESHNPDPQGRVPLPQPRPRSAPYNATPRR